MILEKTNKIREFSLFLNDKKILKETSSLYIDELTFLPQHFFF